MKDGGGRGVERGWGCGWAALTVFYCVLFPHLDDLDRAVDDAVHLVRPGRRRGQQGRQRQAGLGEGCCVRGWEERGEE
jgi:hypothetical protein